MTVSKVFSASGRERTNNNSPISPTNSSLLVPQPTATNNSAPAQVMSATTPTKAGDKSSRRERSSSNDSGFSRDPLDN